MFLSLPSLQGILPRHFLGMSWHQHIPFAFDLISALAPRTFVELGTHSGESYFAFCQAVKEGALPTRCCAIDHWRGDAFTGAYGEELFAQVSAHNQEFYSGFSTLLREDFHAGLARFAPASIDLLHIDGAHDYASVRADFEAALPKLAPGAVVLFHDIAVRERGFEVWRFWAELEKCYPTFSFSHGYGLGVLQISPPENQASEFLRTLFSCSVEQAEKIRAYYARQSQQMTKDVAEARKSAEYEKLRSIGGRRENLQYSRQFHIRANQGIYQGRSKTKLDVILPTHTEGNSQAGARYVGASKREVSLRCLRSLVRSLNSAGPHIDATLTVLDDHSEASAVEEFRAILTQCRYPTRLVSLEERGILHSIQATFDYGLNRSRGGLLYFTQDDYLHEQSAIEEMVDSYLRFRLFLGNEVGISPFNDPFRYYAPVNVQDTRIVHGLKRHWRLNHFSSCVFLTSHSVVQNNFDLLRQFAHSELSPEMEDLSLNKIWQERNVTLFSPLPSVALHLQQETELDPYLPWQAWWESAARL